MKLEIHKAVEVSMPEAELGRLFGLVMQAEFGAEALGVVNLVLTSEAQMQKLNRDFRKLDKPTDVLSFNLDEPTEAEAVLGEIYISAAIAQAQAEEYGASLDEELLRLFAHGLLHLAGYDHQLQSEALKMNALAEQYISAVEKDANDV